MSSLPVDAHVHSEWSWDAGSDPTSAGTMVRVCERALLIGLPGVVFTEHLDLEDDWRAAPGDLGGGTAEKYIDENGRVRLPRFDSGGFIEAIERRRREFPELRILAGIEFGQPHLWEDSASELLSTGLIQRINGPLHMLDDVTGGRSEPATLYRSNAPESVM